MLQRVKTGFIHDEKKGVVAIDQSGVAGTQLRLYLVPKSHEIRLITIGDKSSQKADIKLAHDYVRKQRRKRLVAKNDTILCPILFGM